MKIHVYLTLIFCFVAGSLWAQTTSYYVSIKFGPPPGVYCDYFINPFRLVGTISSSDGTNSASFSIQYTSGAERVVNLPGALNGYRLQARVEVYKNNVWTTCTNISGSGAASLGSNHKVSQYVPETGTTANYVDFDYCWTPYEKQSFEVTGANYDEHIAISKIRYTNPTPTWEVSVNATFWYTLPMPPGNCCYFPPTGATGVYYLIDRDRLRNVLGSSFYGKPLYFRSRYTNACFTTQSDPSVSVQLYALKPTATITSSENARCKGESTGTATINIAHPDVDRFVITCSYLGNSAYDFQVPVAVRGANVISGLRAGAWRFKIENNHSVNPSHYGAAFTELDHTTSEPTTELSAALSPKKYGIYDISCNGVADGQLTASASGGNGGYSYSWAHDAALTGAVVGGLSSGTAYKVTVVDTKGCSDEATYTLIQPDALSVSLKSTGGKGGYGVSCWNKTDGSIAATVTGGTQGGYTYAWSNGGTSNTISSLSVGTYSVAVTDGNGCPASSSLPLTAPDKIDFAIAELSSLVCRGDQTAVLEAQPVTFTIIGTAKFAWASGEPVATVQDKGAGTHTVTVSDGQGCSTTKSIIINDPPGYTASIAVAEAVSCSMAKDGKLVAMVKDASNAPASGQNYLWTKDGVKIAEGGMNTSVDQLEKGTYKVVVTYNGQCKTEASHLLAEPSAVTVDVAPKLVYHGQAISCSGKTDATVEVSSFGGTGAHTYTWSTSATGSSISGVGAGKYKVIAKDANGCIGKDSVTIVDPEPVVAGIKAVSNFSGYGISCSGMSNGSITAEGSGGTEVYSYAWSNMKTTETITGLPAAKYTVTVSDNNGCTSSIDQIITSPPVLGLSVGSKQDVSCFGGNDGKIELQPLGGAGNYRYSRNNGASWRSITLFDTLALGSYTLLVRDGNGCTVSATEKLGQPDKINITFKDVNPAFCNNPAGTATAVVTGGVADYRYSWKDSRGVERGTDAVLSNAFGGAYTVLVTDNHLCQMISAPVSITSTDGATSTYSAVAAKCFDSSDGSATITITGGDGPFAIKWPDDQTGLQGINLKKGKYFVEITDSHKCTVVQPVDVPAPDELGLVKQSEVIPGCYGKCDGQLTLQASGGVGGYKYAWNNSTGASQSLLCAGNYAVNVTDGNGCVLEQTIILGQPDPLEVQVAEFSLPECRDGCDGRLQAEAKGGNGGYEYSWEGGGTTAVMVNICPGAYNISVKDQKGCTGQGVLVLENPAPVPVDLGGGVTLCVGQSYSLDAGANWTSVKWTSNTGFESTQQAITVNEPGTYHVEVLTNKGCAGEDSFVLETSRDLLQALFLIPAEAFAGDTVVMIDVSWPMPENVTWAYPPAMTEVMNLGDVLLGQFDEPGTYDVSLTANLGECRDQISKQIVILKGEDDDIGGRLGYEAFVKTFTLHPNPNDGAFEVGVELREAGPVMISVWSSSSGMQLKQIAMEGSASYLVPIDLRPLGAGTYVLRLDHAQGKDYIRFIVY